MVMNKIELKARLAAMPKFERRDVKVKDTSVVSEEDNWTKQLDQAICKVGESEALCYVKKNYVLTQFETVFTPILEGITEDVRGYLADYGGYAVLKVFPDNEKLIEGDTRFGLMAINSVDCSSAIVIKFCIEKGDMQFTIPPEVAGLKKHHSGNVAVLTKNYLEMIGAVKDSWKHIITSFPKYKIVMQDEATEENTLAFKQVIDRLHLCPRMAKKIKEDYDFAITDNKKTYTLWDLFMKVMFEISKRNYKSDIHREKNLDKICVAVFDYSLALSI